MKLWLLRPLNEDRADKSNPWRPWYDKAFGFVVRAETEADARAIADVNAGDENSLRDWSKGDAWNTTRHPWLDAQFSSCIELTADGEAGLIMQDFHAA